MECAIVELNLWIPIDLGIIKTQVATHNQFFSFGLTITKSQQCSGGSHSSSLNNVQLLCSVQINGHVKSRLWLNKRSWEAIIGLTHLLLTLSSLFSHNSDQFLSIPASHVLSLGQIIISTLMKFPVAIHILAANNTVINYALLIKLTVWPLKLSAL